MHKILIDNVFIPLRKIFRRFSDNQSSIAFQVGRQAITTHQIDLIIIGKCLRHIHHFRISQFALSYQKTDYFFLFLYQ